jgi:hypothetical protein
MTTIPTPLYTFRVSPADPCLLEWRRNQIGAEWLYWCRRQTADEAREALVALERAGLTIERQEVKA